MADSNAPGPAATHCVGRLTLQAPQGFALLGREQHIYLAKVWARDSGAQRPDARWLRQQAEPGLPVVRESDAGAGVRLLWLRATDSTLRALAMREAGSQVALAQADTTEARSAVAQQVLAKVLASWQPQATQGFCLERGALTIEASRNERARASLANGELELTLRTETVPEPVAPPTAATEAEDARAVANGGGHHELLALRERAVAGLPGWERRVMLRAGPGQPERLLHTWMSPGQAANGLAPHVVLQLKGPRSAAASLDQAWEALLRSLKFGHRG